MNESETFISRKNPSLLRGLSIQQRLPLLICILLLSTVIAVGIASYIGVKQSSLRIAGDRLKIVAEQLSAIYGQTSVVAIASARIIANEEPVRNYLQSPGTVTDSIVKLSLQKLQTDTQALYVELLNKDQQRVVRTGRRGVETKIDNRSVLTDLNLMPDSAGVSKIYHIGDSLYYAIVSTVTANKQIIGYLLRWRLVYTTEQGLRQFSQLLGTNASLYVGNNDRTGWSDLIKPVEAPPVNVDDTSKYFTYVRTGKGPVVAAARSIANTKWVILIEFPQQTILETARRFVGWILIIGGIITVAGIFIAWNMSRNITRPLKKLTAASTAIASGDYSLPVETNRRDEVGELARSFSKMSAEIKNARQLLEQKVKDRTNELEVVNKEAELAKQLSIQEKLIAETSIKVQEREREEIGRELHDNINQLLAAAKLYMDYAISKDNLRSERLDQSKLNISRAIEEIRKLSRALVAPSLGDETLVQIIEGLLRDIRLNTPLQLEFVTEQYNEAALNDEIKLALYRIVQEQLNNILKHAKANKVMIRIETTDAEVCLCIRDDGEGFDTGKHSNGIGLRNITTRASHYNGKASIISSPGNGCTLEVVIPV